MQRHLSKLWGIFFLGVWIMVIPLLGVPRSWINAFVIFSGLAVVVTSFLLARGLAQNVPSTHAPRDVHSS
ncbi:MAG: hypothetical protein V4674_03855 [Patescibacteria group bacterium]